MCQDRTISFLVDFSITDVAFSVREVASGSQLRPRMLKDLIFSSMVM